MTTSDGGTRDRDAGIVLSAVMAESVADVRLPAGLLDRAVAGNRKRTARNRLIGAASTVAAVAAAVAVAVSLPSSTATGNAQPRPAVAPKMQTAAYVLARAAAAQLNSRTMISVTWLPEEKRAGTMYTDVATQQQRYVAGIRASDGQPYYEWADRIKNRIWTETMIVNQGRVYSIQSIDTRDAAGLSITPYLPLQAQSNPVTAFNTALKQGLIKVVGHRTLGGRDTILLRIIRDESCKKPLPPGYYKSEGAMKCVNGKMVYRQPPPDDEVWIDARTYLVVQTRTYDRYFLPLKTGGERPVWRGFTTEVSWLPATAANLAKLSVIPPRGYTRIPPTELVNYLGSVS